MSKGLCWICWIESGWYAPGVSGENWHNAGLSDGAAPCLSPHIKRRIASPHVTLRHQVPGDTIMRESTGPCIVSWDSWAHPGVSAGSGRDQATCNTAQVTPLTLHTPHWPHVSPGKKKEMDFPSANISAWVFHGCSQSIQRSSIIPAIKTMEFSCFLYVYLGFEIHLDLLVFWTRYWTFVSDTTQCLGWLRIHWDQASMGQRLKDCQDPDKLSSPGPGLATANHCLLYCKSAGRGDTDPTFHCEDFLVAFIGSKAHSGPALSSIHFIVTFTARSVKLIGARQGALDISYPILWLAANTGNYIKIRDNQSNDYTLITAILMIIIIITLPSSELLAGITQGELSALCLFESWSWWMGGEGEETGATGHIISAADHWYRPHRGVMPVSSMIHSKMHAAVEAEPGCLFSPGLTNGRT